MKKQGGFSIVELMFFVIAGVFVGGWIANAVKLAHMDFGTVTGMLILRAIGVIAAPLGSVLGFC